MISISQTTGTLLRVVAIRYPLSKNCNMNNALRTGVLALSLFALSIPRTSLAQSQNTEIPVTTEPHGVTVVSPQQQEEVGWWGGLQKEEKMLYTNLSIATFIGVYGLIDWDYGSGGFHSSDEGWFESDSKYGGADKLGHLWATYVLSDALTGLYKSYGYSSDKANTYAALSAWSVQAFMELGDATSETQGFSWGDMAMNTVGALTSILMEKFPELDRKVDLRLEYVFNVSPNGIFDDYSNQNYSLALKLDGFDTLENTFLKYIELHAGYYTRGYDSDEEEQKRALYAGISINFSHLFYGWDWNKTGKTLEYLQIPYSVLKLENELD